MSPLLLITLFVCCSQYVLSANSKMGSNVIFPTFLIGSRASLNNEPSTAKTTKQVNNDYRRPVTRRLQTVTPKDENDPFDGFDTFNNFDKNYQPFGEEQLQDSVNGKQRPNRQQNNFGNRPQNSNPFFNNNGNWGQGFQGNNGNRPTNQNQNQFFNNNGNQQQGVQGNNNGNRPDIITPSSNGVSDVQRNACNTDCRSKTTYEYNPVCGSDSLTYQNRKFLECVMRCGIPTDFSYVGSCITTTTRRN